MTPLRAHVLERHSVLAQHMPRSNADLAKVHAGDHHRYLVNHSHEEDNEGALVGPNSDRRRPSGWQTGLKVVERTQ